MIALWNKDEFGFGIRKKKEHNRLTIFGETYTALTEKPVSPHTPQPLYRYLKYIEI